jgi:predicted secreted protein
VRTGLELLSRRLADERSREVVFVSHCLLNENTRYLGGAFHPGVVPEVVEAVRRRGAGIHQMRCPEQRAWGGTLKPWLLPAYGARGTLRHRVRRPLLRAFVAYTRLAYRRLAREAARDIEDYVRSGVAVIGIVGVDASPSCGVATTLDLGCSLAVLADSPIATIDRRRINQAAVAGCVVAGEGLFVRALKRELARRHLDVPFLSHDLVAEMHGVPALRGDLAATGPTRPASR